MKKSSFLEGTIIATLCIFIVKILGMLYVIPFYAMVGIQGSALYAYAYNIYNIFLDISSAGLPIALSKIIKEYDTLGKMEAKQRAFRLGLQIIGIAAISIFIILFIFAPQIGKLLIGHLEGGNNYQDVAFVIRCISASILVVPFLSVSKGYLQGHNIINVSSLSQVIEQIIRIAIILGGSYLAIYILKLNIRHTIGIALSGAFFGALIAFLYIAYKIRKNKKDLNIDKIKKQDDISNHEIINKIITYAVPFIIINAIFSLYNFVDMVIVLRTMDYIGFSGIEVEFISSSITTWCTKISIIISSVAMGMTMNLIPTIVKFFTLNNFKEVNKKLNQALQMIITISVPMAIGLALLCKPVWNVFYGLENNIGYRILAIAVFVAFLGNVFMIVSSTLQSLNKFKLVYKSSILGLLINMILDAPLMIIYSYIGIPAYLGASSASIIGYSISSIYALYHLKKEHNLEYKETFNIIKKLLLPIICMILTVCITMYILPINYNSKFSSIIYIAINSIIGAIVYIGLLIKNKTLQYVMGEDLFNKIFKKISFKK